MRRIVVALLAVLLAGCLVKVSPGHGGPSHGHGGLPPGHGGVPPGQAKKVAHVHGDGCGHLFHAGVWVPAVEIRVAPAHVCVGGCAHYSFRGRWFRLDGHVHGIGCGHFLRAGVWICD